MLCQLKNNTILFKSWLMYPSLFWNFLLTDIYEITYISGAKVNNGYYDEPKTLVEVPSESSNQDVIFA